MKNKNLYANALVKIPTLIHFKTVKTLLSFKSLKYFQNTFRLLKNNLEINIIVFYLKLITLTSEDFPYPNTIVAKKGWSLNSLETFLKSSTDSDPSIKTITLGTFFREPCVGFAVTKLVSV